MLLFIDINAIIVYEMYLLVLRHWTICSRTNRSSQYSSLTGNKSSRKCFEEATSTMQVWHVPSTVQLLRKDPRSESYEVRFSQAVLQCSRHLRFSISKLHAPSIIMNFTSYRYIFWHFRTRRGIISRHQLASVNKRSWSEWIRRRQNTPRILLNYLTHIFMIKFPNVAHSEHLNCSSTYRAQWVAQMKCHWWHRVLRKREKTQPTKLVPPHLLNLVCGLWTLQRYKAWMFLGDRTVCTVLYYEGSRTYLHFCIYQFGDP